MNDSIKTALEKSVVHTLKEMTGLKVEIMDSVSKNKIDYSNVFSIKSIRPEKIRLSFFLPKKLKKIMVESTLNRDWNNLTDDSIDDCLLEIVNVIGGNCFASYFHSKSYRISIPKLNFDDKNSIGGELFFSILAVQFSVYQ